ncbi:hypothetical protein CONPUDRAFT_71627 [Coniophora puteana RWD-64-598 SS2]|uniref:CxC5 like cysteine cluster associated with KDZ domain-containing protein n=1 Tax=Coniophora puteana (strain RWD-64-598) TaxID=741705 RepID=A0A5M3MUY1_CONPW|nr:uncharacterized protein CONPUDRAFT_71627 [Coniophora puteana RWD-64-598 SS2]EIW82978.1 hypothetical protein CONPUDRAFT_71627 [Coniophora puteana RWD-64-598 SS2]
MDNDRKKLDKDIKAKAAKEGFHKEKKRGTDEAHLVKTPTEAPAESFRMATECKTEALTGLEITDSNPDLAGELQFDIANIEDGSVDTESETVPQYLPYVQQVCLAWTAGIWLWMIPVLWQVFKVFVWTKWQAAEEQQQLHQDFEEVGWDMGITLYVLAPLSRKCTNLNCECKNVEMHAQDKDVHDTVVFTAEHGPQVAKAMLLTCPACNTCYRDNYCVHSKSDTCTYYFDLPNFIQVGDHHFVETSMVKGWTNSMVVSHTSATNLATAYELSHTRDLDLYYLHPHISRRDASLPYSGVLYVEQPPCPPCSAVSTTQWGSMFSL